MPVLPKPVLFMAPMVDLSHVAYRELIRGFGGCDLFYSEMLNSRIVPVEPPQTSMYLRWTRSDDLIFQLLGNDPDKMSAAAAILDGFGPWGIDVNMGCWLKKVTCHGWGAALMKDVGAAQKVFSSVRRSTQKSVSAKIRIGFQAEMSYMLDFASMLEDEGADFIVLHARTVADGMTRKARWEYIGALKDRLSIPVIGNGDISSPKDALDMMRLTGCDGVMVGRSALSRPWIFRDIKALLRSQEPEPTPDLIDVIRRLHTLLAEHFPEDVALKRFKTASVWLAQNLSFGHYLVKQLGRVKTMNDAMVCLTTCFDRGIC